MASVLINLTNKVAGDYPAVGINERAARITCAFTGFNYFTGFVVALFLGLGFDYTIFQLAASIPFFILFYLLVKRRYVQQVIALLVIILSGSFIVGWFYAGGINGPFIAGGLVIFYVALNVVLVKNRLHVSIYMISVMSVTILMNYLHPRWVVDYPESSGRYADYTLMLFQLSAYFIFIEASNRYCYNYEQNLVTERNLQLEQANEAKLKLLSIISHDLRGPMATLRGILGALDEGFYTPEKAQRQLTHLRTMTSPINNTLNNLLLWSRFQLEGLHAIPELFSVGDILAEEILLASEDTATKQITIDNRIPANTMVTADMNQLRIVFRNLISNAIRYANVGSTIQLVVETMPAKYTFSVSNVGAAIPLAEVQRFNQTGKLEGVETNTKTPGLGLQLCYDFVKLNGGSIWIDTSVSGKTVFCFSSPKPN